MFKGNYTKNYKGTTSRIEEYTCIKYIITFTKKNNLTNETLMHWKPT